MEGEAQAEKEVVQVAIIAAEEPPPVNPESLPEPSSDEVQVAMEVDKPKEVTAVPPGTTITVVDAGQSSDLGGLLQASEMMEIISQEVTTLAQGNTSTVDATTTVTPVMTQNGVVLQASELMKQIMEQVNIKQEDGEEAPCTQTVYAEIRPSDEMVIEDAAAAVQGKADGTEEESEEAAAQEADLVDPFTMYTTQAQDDAQAQEMMQQQNDLQGGSTKVLHVQATQEPIDGDSSSSQPSSRTLTVVITNFPDHLKTQILSYSCMSCGSAFTEVVDLMAHVCTGTAPLIANASSVVINTGRHDLDPNKTIISTADLFYNCDECPKKFVKKLELIRHKQVHKKSAKGMAVMHPIINRVELMSTVEDTQKSLDGGVFRSMKSYQCNICMKTCKRKFDLKRHILTHDKVRERPHTCAHCDKRFLTASHLRQHLRAHAGIKPFACEDCGKGFTRSSEVNRHKVVHLRNTMSYECTDCSSSFASKKELQLHLFEKHTFQCKQCAAVFPNKNTLDLHMAEHREEVYTCLECSMVFVHKKQLKQHNKQVHRDKHHHRHHHHKHHHNDVQVHVCEECGKEFKKSSDLKRHMVTHTERERKHECVECNKKFLTSSHLKAHFQQKHSDDRPNACPFCDKKFARKHDLKRHEAIHSIDRERPYKCEHCDKSYISGSHLRDHLVVHTGMRPYTCEICGSAFTLQRALLRHLKDNHKIDP